MAKAYNLPIPSEPFDPAVYRLGRPCKRNHFWDKTSTLRLVKNSLCPLCCRIDSRLQKRNLRKDPEYLAKHAAVQRERRQRLGRPYRGKHSPEWHAQRRLWAAINRAGKLPAVPQLVHAEQKRYWREHPDEHKKFAREREKWRHTVDPNYRLYHRQKSKRRKALMRNSVGIQIKGEQIRRRFAEFDHCCAYCGATGDLHIEHVVPISKGGTHELNNIVSACQSCNYSKMTKEVQAWYQAQPFFSKQRWRKIQRVLRCDSSQQSIKQMALL